MVSEGCSLLYQSGYGAGTPEKIIRGFVKSFRRGSAFARKYLSDFRTSNETPTVLEVGAGDGYFSAGIQAEIPGATIWLIDVVKELVDYYNSTHDCVAIQGEFENSIPPDQKFDLIIFRDLLEHVREPSHFLACVNRAAKPGAKIFFITPNGREDFWMINQRFMKTGQSTLLLLNHFHYFLPSTLERMMGKNGFEMIDGFKFGLKQHRRGLGQKEFTSFGEQQIPTNTEKPINVKEVWRHNPGIVRKHILGRPGIVSKLYGAIVDHENECTDFYSDIGHEFSVLAQKTSDILI